MRQVTCATDLQSLEFKEPTPLQPHDPAPGLCDARFIDEERPLLADGVGVATNPRRTAWNWTVG